MFSPALDFITTERVIDRIPNESSIETKIYSHNFCKYLSELTEKASGEVIISISRNRRGYYFKKHPIPLSDNGQE